MNKFLVRFLLLFSTMLLFVGCASSPSRESYQPEPVPHTWQEAPVTPSVLSQAEAECVGGRVVVEGGQLFCEEGTSVHYEERETYSRVPSALSSCRYVRSGERALSATEGLLLGLANQCFRAGGRIKKERNVCGCEVLRR